MPLDVFDASICKFSSSWVVFGCLAYLNYFYFCSIQLIIDALRIAVSQLVGSLVLLLGRAQLIQR